MVNCSADNKPFDLSGRRQCDNLFDCLVQQIQLLLLLIVPSPDRYLQPMSYSALD